MIDLLALQLKAEAEFSIESTRETLGKITKFFLNHELYEEAMQAFSELRCLSMDIIRECECFFVPDDMVLNDLPEEFHHESIGFVKKKRLVYAGRIVYPVKDVKGQVIGFCGWDVAELPKYLDSKNHGYKAKMTTLYGMEKLPEYYNSSRSLFLVEGIPCCNYLRSQGFQSLAALGSRLTKYVIVILKRFGFRLIVIPDNDAIGSDFSTANTAGNHFIQQVKKELPNAFILQCTHQKDIDDTRREDNFKYEQGLLADLRVLDTCPPFDMLNEFKRR